MTQLLFRLALWIVVFSVAGEGLTRLLLTSPSTQISDKQLGYVNLPNADLFLANEGFQHIQLNSLGLNNAELAPTSTSKRLLFIGDSMLLAHQVPRARNYASLIEDLTGLDIVNGGRDAMGPAQWNIMVDRLNPKVRPDYDVMVMSRGDAYDLRDSDVRFLPSGPGGKDVRVVLKPDDRDFVEDHFGPALRESALLTYLARRGNQFSRTFIKGDSWLAFVARRFHHAPRVKDETIDFPRERITEQLTELMRIAEGRQRTVFISIPSLVYHAGGASALEPRSQVEREIFPEAARRAGVPFLDLGPDLQAIYAADHRPFAGFNNSVIGVGHLNEYGHSVVARLIARRLPSLMRQADAAHAHLLAS